MFSRTLLVSCAVLSGLLGLAACTESVTGPQNGEAVEFWGLPFHEYHLMYVNGDLLPTVAVEGTCPARTYEQALPDSIWIDGGRLRLGDDRFELYYTWRGETDDCTSSRAHWHRLAAGRYARHGDAIAFLPEPGWVKGPTLLRGNAPAHLEGSFAGSASIEVEWGALRLTFR